MSAVFDLTRELIHRVSVTPDDAGCQAVIAERLARAGFAIEHLRHGEVDNLWAMHGTDGPVFLLLGHTDVVPSGPVEAWTNPPFEPTLRNGHLYARGAADMKSGVAAMVVARRRFADHAPVNALVALPQFLRDAAHAVDRRALLVRGQQQRDHAGVIGTCAHECLQRDDHRGDAGFHVRRTTAV